MATDYVTTPISNLGKVVFVIGCAILTFVIRAYCSLPEGVSFAILTMNLFVPIIEKLTANKPLGGE
jgi:Predicted NADH:ubiquinone oxidoreductase, subunit RnfD